MNYSNVEAKNNGPEIKASKVDCRDPCILFILLVDCNLLTIKRGR